MAASHTIIYNKDIRSRFNAWLEAGELNAGHVFAWPAVEAAYTYGLNGWSNVWNTFRAILIM